MQTVKFQSIFEKLNSHVYHLGKCKNHGENCGRQALPGSKDHGKCCEGTCIFEQLGAIGKCDKGIFLII